ncbi:MAG: tetratricopeptide repeat protein [Gemmataceae bacterium]
MRKINGKVFLLLLAGVVLAVGGVAALNYFQYHRIGRALLFQARRHEEQGDKAKSAQYLQRYLDFNPKDNAEKANLARLWAGDAYPPGSKARGKSVKLLDELLRQGDDPELRRLLVRVAVEQFEFKMAHDHLEKLLPCKDVEAWAAEDKAARKSGKALPEFMTREDAGRGELECWWGQVMEFEKKPAEAVACYRLAVRHAPRLRTASVQLATLLRRQNETDPVARKKSQDEADALIDRLVAANPESHEPYLARWRYRREFSLLRISETANQGQVELEAAAEDVTQALKRRPESVDVLLVAADLERLRGRSAFDDAKRSPEDRRAGLKEHRGRALEYLSRGEGLTAKDRTPAGEAAAFQLLWHKGNLMLDDLDLQRAREEEERLPTRDDSKLKGEVAEVIARVRKSHMPAAADYMQARLLVCERRWGDAAALFERARNDLASQRDLACQADLYLGQCYERLEQPTQMFKAFQRVLEFDPESLPAMLGMAAARWSQGQLDNALAQYQVVMKQKRVPVRAWIDIARLETQRQAQSPTPDWKRLEMILTAAREALPEANVELTLAEAELRVRQGRPTDAREVLEKARKKAPAEVEYWVALVDLALRQKDSARARALLREARGALDDRVSLRLAEARVLFAEEGRAATAKIAKLADDRARFGEDDQARLLTGAADLLFRAGGQAEARRLWQAMTGLAKHRTDLRLQLLLFDLAMKENDDAGLLKTLDDIRAIEQSSGTYYLYGQALHTVWRTKRGAGGEDRDKLLAQARRQVDSVLAQRPGWSPAFLARAEIAELQGNPEQAIKDLQEAVNQGENSPSVLRRLIALLMQRGRDGEAKVQLAKLHQSVLYNSDLGKLAVVAELRDNNTAKAVERMRQVVREDTKDPQDLVWMARVLGSAGQTGEAEKRLLAAVEAGAGEPAPWLALVQFLASSKRKADAVAAIAKAKEKLPADKASLTLARCYDVVGEPKQSLSYYEEALRKNPNDAETVWAVANAHLAANRGPQAEPLLRRLVSEARAFKGGNAALTANARRALAMLLAAGTDYERFTEALALVGLKLDSAGRLPAEEPHDESTEDRRAKARVLASQSQRQFRERAVHLLKELERSKALTPDDEFVLALLYEQEGEYRKSLEMLEALADPKRRTPQYLAQYAMSLVVQQKVPADLDKAERVVGWIEELERQREAGPNAFASVELRARLLEARGKGEEALQLIRRHTSREGARPDEVLLVLSCLSRQKRYQEAYELCERAWQEGKCSPEVVGGVSVSLLRVMSPTDAQVARVERHLRSAIDKRPDSTALLLHLSDLHDKRGQYDKAAAAYREVLRREPNNIVALNNLAWLLAHRSGEAGVALEHINKAVSGMGRRPDLLDTRGVIHLALRDTARALADLREASAEEPTPVRLFHLAKAHHADRDTTRAREVLRQAKEKGLQVAQLHPVEQDAARRLLDEYGIR